MQRRLSSDEFRAKAPFVIGTRGSPLALYQARLVQRLLCEAYGVPTTEYDTIVPIQIFKTSGDKLKGRLTDVGGKGLFVKELEEALLHGHVHLAVHSMKDVPTFREKDLVLAAILEREDPRDAFISHVAASVTDLPQGAILGTASLRRQAQALRLRPDLSVKLLRGNVGTRLDKLESGFCDATFLAGAGLKRLGQADVITSWVGSDTMLSAPAQGAIGIETREDDGVTRTAVQALHHGQTDIAITAERSFLQALDGNCRTPIAALAEIDGGVLRFRGQALAPDGTLSFERDTTIQLSDDPRKDAMGLGHTLGADIRIEAGDRIVWDA